MEKQKNEVVTLWQERFALWLAGSTFLVMLGLSFITFELVPRQPIDFTALRVFISMVAPLVAFAVITLTYIDKRKQLDGIDRQYWWLFLPILGVSLSYFAGEMSIIVLYTFSRSFREFIFDPVSATLFISTSMSLLAYILSLEIFRMNLKKLSLFTGGFVMTGFLLTGAYHYDPRWWAGSLCALGMGMGYTGAFYIYNTTIAITSLLLLLIGLYVRPYFDNLVTIGKSSHAKVLVLKVAFFLVIIQLFIVGVIPFGHGHWLSLIHNFAGNMVFVTIGATIAVLPLIIRKLHHYFYIFNYLVLVLGIGFYYLYNTVHYFTITFYEINSIIIIIIWFIVLIKYTEVLFLHNGKRPLRA